MNKPSGKLAMAYQTIAKMENQIANLVSANDAALDQLNSVTNERDALAAQIEQLQQAISTVRLAGKVGGL